MSEQYDEQVEAESVAEPVETPATAESEPAVEPEPAIESVEDGPEIWLAQLSAALDRAALPDQI